MPRLGMMAQPFTGERFAGDGRAPGTPGPAARSRSHTRPAAALAEAALFTTSPYLFSAAEGEAYRRIEKAVRLARYGCDCYAYCMVAAGQADIVVEAGLQPYDIVALIPIVEGAGGRLTAWDGGSAAKGGRVCATGDARIHDLVLAELGECLSLTTPARTRRTPPSIARGAGRAPSGSRAARRGGARRTRRGARRRALRPPRPRRCGRATPAISRIGMVIAAAKDSSPASAIARQAA